VRYIGTYTDDFKQVRQRIILPVYLVSQTQERILTDSDTDSQYLPDIFYQKTQSFDRLATCEIPITLIYAKLWLSAESYIKVPIPFSPNSQNFNLFFRQVNDSNKFLSIGYKGEIISEDWVKWYATK
jgi:hypothetical protein